MKGIILHDHEVKQLSTVSTVLVVRAMKPQPIGEKLEPSTLEFIAKKKLPTVLTGYSHGIPIYTHISALKCPFTPIGTRFRVRQIQGLCVIETELVKVKRVQDVDNAAVLGTGISMESVCDEWRHGGIVKSTPYVKAFAREWDRHNPNHPWDSNPWCWYVTFKRV